MAILGRLLKKGITLRESIEQLYTSPLDLQKQELRNLLIHCQNTQFGRHFDFTTILKTFKGSEKDRFYESFSVQIPIFDYEKIYNNWWIQGHKAFKGNITWPGKIKYYALSSGTSGTPSKHIPITGEMIKSIKRTSMRQMLTLPRYDLPKGLFNRGMLMLGGSTDLRRNAHYFEGDLSGITTSQIPFWFQHLYKPGKKIAKTRDWNEKLEEIVRKAPDWDIGIILGVPAWLQLLLERIIEVYKVRTIHDIWPNLTILVHGGVSFEPYKKGFERLLTRPLIYMETYLASEGFLAFQAFPDRKSMRLVLNNGIFYEFILFNSENFDEEGNLKDTPQTLKIDEVDEGVDYALVITTNAGAWRYLIGDVIKFSSKEESEIMIVGRTKHFMSLCGEHLSLENMNKAIELTENDLNIDIREFTLLGEPYKHFFAHRWYIGTDDPVDPSVLRNKIDGYLQELNDDYKTERSATLKEILIEVYPLSVFYRWMELQGRFGSQHKFPRVLKKEKAENWKTYLSEATLSIS